MKKILLALMVVCLTVAATGQKQFSELKGNQLYLSGKRVLGISTNPNFDNPKDDSLVTQKALADYIGTIGSCDSLNYAVVDDIPALAAYDRNGAVTVALVKAAIPGGLFTYSSTGTDDNIITYAAIGGGHWVRSYSGLVSVGWAGATVANSSAANTTIIDAVMAAGYYNLYVPFGITYNATSLNRTNLNKTILLDENISGLQLGSSASFRKSGNQASHATLKSAITNNPSGLWIEGNGTYPYTPDATGVYNAFKLSAEDLDIETLNGTNNYGDGTIVVQDTSVTGVGCIRYNITQNGDFQGDWLSVEHTFQQSNYRSFYEINLQHDTAKVGGRDYYNWGGRKKAFWYAGRPTTTGDLVLVNFRVYQATATGTTGVTKPVHTTGTVSDGGITWTYIENLSQNVSGNRHRPATIFGDVPSSASVPAIGWNNAAVHFGEDVLFYPNAGMDFINSTKRIRNARIEALSPNAKGLKITIDSATVKNVTISTNRFVVNNLQIVPTNSTKATGATTLDLSGCNNVGFVDATATSFTQFTGSAPNVVITVYFSTANTTLVESSNLRVGGYNYLVPANTTLQFYMIDVDRAVLITAIPNIYDSGPLTYAGTVTWNTGTAPLTVLAQNYRWDRVGKKVHLRLNISYTTPGVTNTSVSFTWPSDMPVPEQPVGFVNANDFMYVGTGSISSAPANVSANNADSYIENNATNTGPILNVKAASVSAKVVLIDITYYTP